MTNIKIKELPPAVFREMCQYLCVDGLDGVRNWKDLAGLAECYTTRDIAAFGRAGSRPNTNPAEQVLFDFVAQGFRVDRLYRMFFQMEARECMDIIEDYVSQEVVEDVREQQRAREQARLIATLPDPIINDPADTAVPKDIDPFYGPLPPHPPPPRTTTPSHHHTPTPSHHYTSTNSNGSPHIGTPPISSSPSVSTTPSSVGMASSGSGHKSPPFLLAHRIPGQAFNQGPRLPGFPHGDMQQTRTNGASNYQFPNEGSSPIYIPPSYKHTNGYHDNKRHLQWDIASTNGTASTTISVGSSTTTASGKPHPLQYTPTSGFSPSQTDYSTPSPSTPSSAGSFKNLPENAASGRDSHSGPNILRFSYTELSEATGDFTKDIIGIGSFGTVFKAKIRGNGPFAIKKLHNEREMGGLMFYEAIHHETFTQELQLLTKYNHRNILSLVAYSNDGPMPCLVYEYMENGSLAECLQGRVLLSWRHRLNIATQIADALHFLHTVNKPQCLVHGDVKSANILLDAHLVPKLSDFGLARECQVKPNQRSTYSTKSDIVMGTMAYMAPEFIRNKKFKPHTDVYSFGVVLLELYTGLPALSDDPDQRERVLTDRLSDLIEESESHQREILNSVDPRASWPQQTALDFFDIVTVCLRHKPKERPPMEQVLVQLQMIE